MLLTLNLVAVFFSVRDISQWHALAAPLVFMRLQLRANWSGFRFSRIVRRADSLRNIR
jgi:hypothetical protein